MYDHNFAKFEVFWTKSAIFLEIFIGEYIFKIMTSVPGLSASFKPWQADRLRNRGRNERPHLDQQQVTFANISFLSIYFSHVHPHKQWRLSYDNSTAIHINS
jgi:hypothetical protein